MRLLRLAAAPTRLLLDPLAMRRQRLNHSARPSPHERSMTKPAQWRMTRPGHNLAGFLVGLAAGVLIQSVAKPPGFSLERTYNELWLKMSQRHVNNAFLLVSSATVHYRQAPVDLRIWIETTVRATLRRYLFRLLPPPHSAGSRSG